MGTPSHSLQTRRLRQWVQEPPFRPHETAQNLFQRCPNPQEYTGNEPVFSTPFAPPRPQKMAGGETHRDYCSRMSPLFLSLPSLPHPPRWPQLKVETHNRAPSYFLAQHNTARTFAEGSPTSEQVGLGVKSCSLV